MPENEVPTEDTAELENAPENASEGTSEAPETESDPEGTEALGDAGKKALDSMKSRWREERDRRRELEDRLSALESKPEDKPDADAIRKEAEAKARTEFGIRLEAKGRLADENDVQRYPEYFRDVDADDPASVKAAVDELLEAKPHLAATAGKRFQGTADGGAARKAAGPSQLTRDDLRSMTPAQIVAAKKEGRLNSLFGGSK